MEMTVDTKNAEVSRQSLLHSRAKLWCRQCGAIRQVIDARTLARLAVLQCGHTRPMNF
jgi:hypothetical protein